MFPKGFKIEIPKMVKEKLGEKIKGQLRPLSRIPVTAVMGSRSRRRFAGAARAPVTVLTGFLGAGKTTLLNRILNGDHGLRVGVLVNDFGSVNIDADLVVDVDSDVVSLANGCVCCSIRDDLVQAIHATWIAPSSPNTCSSRRVASPSRRASPRRSWTTEAWPNACDWTASPVSWTPSRSSPCPS